MTTAQPASRTGGTDRALPFADDKAALAWLDAERADLVATVFQAAGDHGVPDELVVQLASMLYAYFLVRSHWTDWLAVDETALAVARRAGDLPGQAQMHNDLAAHHWRIGDHEAALGCLEESLTLDREQTSERRTCGAATPGARCRTSRRAWRSSARSATREARPKA